MRSFWLPVRISAFSVLRFFFFFFFVRLQFGLRLRWSRRFSFVQFVPGSYGPSSTVRSGYVRSLPFWSFVDSTVFFFFFYVRFARWITVRLRSGSFCVRLRSFGCSFWLVVGRLRSLVAFGCVRLHVLICSFYVVDFLPFDSLRWLRSILRSFTFLPLVVRSVGSFGLYVSFILPGLRFSRSPLV